MPFSILLITMMVIAPIIIKIDGRSPILSEVSCPPRMDGITIQYDRGTSINVTRENVYFPDRVPNFHIGIFRRNTHGLADNNFIQALTTIAPPITLFYTLDYQSNHEVFVVIKTDKLPQPNKLLYLCGFWDQSPNLARFRIFRASLIMSK